jgi:hypothetical protein
MTSKKAHYYSAGSQGQAERLEVKIELGQVYVTELLDGRHRSALPVTVLHCGGQPVSVYWLGDWPDEQQRVEIEARVLEYVAAKAKGKT